jgi:hypothetical protein
MRRRLKRRFQLYYKCCFFLSFSQMMFMSFFLPKLDCSRPQWGFWVGRGRRIKAKLAKRRSKVRERKTESR